MKPLHIRSFIAITVLFFSCTFLTPAYAIEKQFIAKHSGLCLSTTTDSAVSGASIVQADCVNNRSRWDVVPVKGDLYRIVSKTNGLCLGTVNDSSSNSELAQQVCNDNIAARLWRFNLIGSVNDRFYEVRNGLTYRCANVTQALTTPGTKILQWNCNRGEENYWKINNGVPDTAAQTELRLLLITKPVTNLVDSTGNYSNNMSVHERERLRYLGEIAMPRYIHDYTNGRLKLKVHYYESPVELTSLALGGPQSCAGNIPGFSCPEFVTAENLVPDMENIFHTGWYDGVLVYHGSRIHTAGLVAFSSSYDGEPFSISNVKFNSGWSFFTGNNPDDITYLAGSIHEWMHQVEGFYKPYTPTRFPSPVGCNSGSFLDCADFAGYQPNTEGVGEWMAFLRDYINGYIDYGNLGMGQTSFDSTPLTAKDVTFIPKVPGGFLTPFENKSTCLNLTQASGTIVRDLNKNNNHAQIRNSNNSTGHWTGTGFKFDGVDDYLRMANLIGDDFTISTWVKSSQVFPTSAQSATGINLIYSSSSTGNGFALTGMRNAQGADVLKFTAGGFASIISNIDITTNQWVHVAVTRHRLSGAVSLYINGQLQVSGNVGTERLNQNPIVKIGSGIHSADYFSGEITDLCLFNNELSSSSIAALAQTRKLFDLPDDSGSETFLSDMPINRSSVGFGQLGIDKNAMGGQLKIGTSTYLKGLGTHANSKIIYQLDGKASIFRSDIGIDANNGSSFSSADFLVFGDGNLLYRSADKKLNTAPESISIDVRGVNELILITTEGKTNRGNSDHTNWGNARIVNTASSTWKRTIVFIFGQTQTGQDMFIRGGLDHTQASKLLGLSCTAENKLCAIPIKHRNFKNATTTPWKVNDHFLDWYGTESGQSSTAQGSPLDWTTNIWPSSWGTKRTVDIDGYGETPFNIYGQHYWMLDVDMDCSKTVNGWFELKSFISNGPGWEGNVGQPGTPYTSGNHFAQCGKRNVFSRGSNAAEITNLP